MKLATLRDGTRDGKLVVVSRDLTRYTDASFLVKTLQAALDDWMRISPHLAAMAESLETGAVPSARFHEHDATSPLPRAFGRIIFPDSLEGHAVASSGHFAGARDAVLVSRDAPLDVSIEIAAIFDDLPAGAARDDVQAAIRLVMLGNSVREQATEAGGGEISSAWSPVAVTPDELGTGWDAIASDLSLHVTVSGRPLEHAGTRYFSGFAERVMRVTQSRPLCAGTIVASPATEISASLQIGDTIRIEMRDKAGHSIFGAIEQSLQRPG